MDIFRKINKGVGVAATAIIIAGGTPQVVHAVTNPENAPKIQEKQLCKDIEESIKGGTYKVSPCINMNTSSENKSELIAKVEIKTLKQENDEPSMAGTYLNKEARYIKENGKIYCEIDVLALDWMKNISIEVEGKKVEHTQKETGKAKVMEMEHTAGLIKFEVPKVNPKLTFHMYVVPMSSDVTFRVVGEKVTTFETSEKQQPKENEKPQTKTSTDGMEKSEVHNKDKKSDKKDIDNKKGTKQKQSSETKSYEKVTTASNKDKDGLYEVNIKALKENNNEPSMAGTYVGDKIKVQMKNGKKYAMVTFSRSDWMNNMDVLVNNKSQKYDVVNVKTNSTGEKISTIKFKIPNLDSEIKFKMNVEPMDNARVTFRVLMQKDSLKFLEGTEYDPTKAEEYLNNLANESKESKYSKGNLYNYNDNNNHIQYSAPKKKLPKTGLPFGGGLVASIGGVLSGLGITLMKKNKKKGE
ncbi:NEAT domain-containing protein [Clostridium novyi]|uniref:Conserved protein n=1 Tax=Clostridium novyi (strain NT) TaxID=386415 RepID=A0PYS3_CLONN|nr:NEAT domain-containing protein [Clostridium novyi]ABK61993.1 conserved protein [Clostridium novyi NT]KEH86785.1 hypothetical protein Z966_01895 [Clostridium novyi A str. NCTC 538]